MNKYLRLYGIISLLIFCVCGAKAQDYLTNFTTYSIRDGLSSRFVYQFLEDNYAFALKLEMHHISNQRRSD